MDDQYKNGDKVIIARGEFHPPRVVDGLTGIIVCKKTGGPSGFGSIGETPKDPLYVVSVSDAKGRFREVFWTEELAPAAEGKLPDISKIQRD